MYKFPVKFAVNGVTGQNVGVIKHQRVGLVSPLYFL